MSKGDVRYIASGARRAGNAFAEIINDDVVESRATRQAILAGGRSWKNPVEDLNYLQHLDFQACFFQQLPSDSGL